MNTILKIIRPTVLVVFLLQITCQYLFAQQDCPPRAERHSAITPQSQDWSDWHHKHKKFNKIALSQKPDLVFLGDSIFENWQKIGSTSWKRYYASRRAASFSIAGDRTQHLLWRIKHGNLKDLNPEIVVVLIGTNNIKEQRNTAIETSEGIEAVVDELVKLLPDSRILLLGILPCGESPKSQQRIDAQQVNSLLHQRIKHEQVELLDFTSKFVESNGVIPKQVMPDFLHPSAAGYEILAAALEPSIANRIALRSTEERALNKGK